MVSLPPANLQLSNTFRLSKKWIKTSGISVDVIKRELTVEEKDNSTCLFFENSDFLYVPRYYGLQKWSRQKDLVILLQMGIKIPHDHCQFNAILDEQNRKQATATQTCLAKLFERKSFGCVLRMPCGYGKTVCALYLISQRQCKTIYILQAEHLFNQTVAAIGKFLPNARVGQIQGPPKTWTTNDVDIVVAMMQTLYAHRKELKSELTLQFGFVIVDECHHVGAPTFCVVLQKFAPAWMLGLTATPLRQDGKTKWIEWMLGPIVDVFEDCERKRADIHVKWSRPLPTSFDPNHLTFQIQQSKKREKWHSVILFNLIQWDIKRRNAQVDCLFDVVSKLEYITTTPQVVVFAPRVFQLCLISYALQRRYVTQNVANLFDNEDNIQTISRFLFFHEPMEKCIQSTLVESISSVSLYYQRYGRNKTFQQQIDDSQSTYLKYVNSLGFSDFLFPMRVLSTQSKKAEKMLDRTVVFATIRKLGEGTDVDSLHTVVLLSSISTKNMGQFEQVIGRLRKAKDTNVQKQIIDFRDDAYSMFRIQGINRQKFYKSRGMPQTFM